jgi:hypothetical protein
MYYYNLFQINFSHQFNIYAVQYFYVVFIIAKFYYNPILILEILLRLKEHLLYRKKSTRKFRCCFHSTVSVLELLNCYYYLSWPEY